MGTRAMRYPSVFIYKSVILAKARTSGRMKCNADIGLPRERDALEMDKKQPDIGRLPYRPEVLAFARMTIDGNECDALSICFIYKSVILAKARTSGRTKRNANIGLPRERDALEMDKEQPDIGRPPNRPEVLACARMTIDGNECDALSICFYI